MTTRLSFEAWKYVVNTHIQRLAGLDADDLPDFGYRDAYDDGATPLATAKRAIKAAQE